MTELHKLEAKVDFFKLRYNLEEKVSILSNDMGKVDSISFVMRQRCFPHIGMFSFLHRECINLHEGRLRNKMHLHSTLKGCFFCVKRF